MTTDEPHFGEVWQWQDMGPFMLIGMSPMTGMVNAYTLAGDDAGRLVSLHWNVPGKDYITYWKRIDTEELG
jgi:hypothetical protein